MKVTVLAVKNMGGGVARVLLSHPVPIAFLDFSSLFVQSAAGGSPTQVDAYTFDSGGYGSELDVPGATWAADNSGGDYFIDPANPYGGISFVTGPVTDSLNAIPAGPLAVATDALRTLIAAVPFFQSWTGSTASSEALASVFIGEVGFPVYSLAVAGGTLTVVTKETTGEHDFQGFTSGMLVTLQGASIGTEAGVDLDGEYTVASATTSGFTATTSHNTVATIYPDQAFVLPGTRPFAVIMEAEDALTGQVAWTGGGGVFTGALDIMVEADVSEPYQNDSYNALTEARNLFGSFAQGLIATQNNGDLFAFNELTTVAMPQFVDRAEADDNKKRYTRWRAMLRVSWGVQA